MTEKEIKDLNPWKSISLDLLYSEEEKYVYHEDKTLVESFNSNKRLLNPEIYKLWLNIPPEPWQGNPLTAKVIFLTLNPGYVEGANKKLAKVIQENKELLGRILAFKNATLRLESTSFMPTPSENEKPISTKDAISMLGDWYWEKGLKKLREAVCFDHYSEDQFYKDIAILQFHAYTSEKYKDVTSSDIYLPSQEFNRKLIEYRIQSDNTPIFVIMRSSGRWEKLLTKGGLWGKMDKLTKGHKGISQAISPNNLKDEKNDEFFSRICKKLNPNY